MCQRRKILSKGSAEDLPIWGALHEIIQWILYIPVVLGLTLVFNILFNLLSTFRGDLEGMFLYLQTPLNAGLSAILFVWLGLNLAPRRPRVCAWVIYSIWSIFVLLSIVRFFAIVFFEGRMSIQQSDVIELLQGVGWLVAGIFFLLRWGKEFAPAKVPKNEQST